MGASLITLNEYKTYKGLVTTKSDDLLNLLIPKVSQFVKDYCRRTFVDHVSSDKIEFFNGNMSEFILEEEPVISVASVEYSSDYGSTYTPLVLNTDYYLDNKTKYPKSIPEVFAYAANGYKVTYRAGYTVLPEDLFLAVADLVNYYTRNDTAVHSNKAPGTNSVQIEYISTTSLPASIKRVLDMYINHYL